MLPNKLMMGEKISDKQIPNGIAKNNMKYLDFPIFFLVLSIKMPKPKSENKSITRDSKIINPKIIGFKPTAVKKTIKNIGNAVETILIDNDPQPYASFSRNVIFSKITPYIFPKLLVKGTPNIDLCMTSLIVKFSLLE